MKRFIVVFVVTSIFFTVNAFGLPVFTEDFEGDLSGWTGKNDGPHKGLIVSDPDLLQSDNALTFTGISSGGDIFTTKTFDQFAAGSYVVSFDYLGTCDGDNCGGFIGISNDFSGSNVWLGGTDPYYAPPNDYPDILPDTGQWEHVVIGFVAAWDFHLMLEDFSSSGAPLDAYFDNIVLNAVPEPGTVLLLGAGLLGLVGLRRKLKK